MATPLSAVRRDWSARAPEEVTAASSQPEKRVFRRDREAAALLLIAGSVYVALAIASFSRDPSNIEISGPNWVGPVGTTIANFLVGTVGVSACLAPVELLLMALPLLRDRPSVASIARIGGDVLVIIILSALTHVCAPEARAFGAMSASGVVGELFGEVMRSLFSVIGSYIIGFTAIGLILIARASFSFISFARRAGRGTEFAAERTLGGMKTLRDAWIAARGVERSRADQAGSSAATPAEVTCAEPTIIAAINQDLSTARSDAEAAAATAVQALADIGPDDPTPDRAPTALVVLDGCEVRAEPSGAQSRPAELVDGPAVVALAADGDDRIETPLDSEDGDQGHGVAAASNRSKRKRTSPRIIDTSQALLVEKAATNRVPTPEACVYELPTFDLLDEGTAERLVIDDDLQKQLNDNATLLVTTLAHYGVSGLVREIQPGPTVTTYELEPEPGTKVSKIAALADDLAMNLACQVRIVAPIPGKKRVGFEVPNRIRRTVNLRELIEDRRFQEIRAPLPVVLGRDIVGTPFYADLSSMPHVLVAGATGAGKSVGLNVMLTSLVYRRTPEDLRLLMIDPKIVELQTFDRIPHMLLPVVTDVRQATNALKWAVDEMERRYQLLANAGTKNIITYNAWVERVHRGGVPGYAQPSGTVVTAADGSIVEIGPEKEPAKIPDKLPFIVIVVDEFSDLMMQQGKDVEASIARLAQKARAAGMHVILATQRPSVDVITGMIKANFPTRIAFKVTQRIDSRTILDEQGAEHLLGRGDMLVKLNGTNELRRVQCPFVSEEEVERVAAFLRRQGDPQYDEAILRARDDSGDGTSDDDAERDPKYDEAVQIVRETRRCSTSWLQRKLTIGYNRAAKIVETMEKRGLVGPANGARERDVLVDPL